MLSVDGKFLDWECNIGWSEYGMCLPSHDTGGNRQFICCLPRSTCEYTCIVVEFVSSISFCPSLLFYLSRQTIAYQNIRLNQRCIHRPLSWCLFSCSLPLLLLYLVVGFGQGHSSCHQLLCSKLLWPLHCFYYQLAAWINLCLSISCQRLSGRVRHKLTY
jgi:hypothetical protein